MAQPEFYSGRILYPAIAVLVGLSTLFGLAILPRLSSGQNELVGKPAPALALPVAANGDPGARMSLADLGGKTVILDFWASWCGPCAAQAPILDRLARRYGDRGLVVLGVNVDDSADVARAYATKKGLSYPILLDSGSESERVYGVKVLPSIIVVDKEGRVVSYTSGLVDEGTLDELVTSLM